MRFLKLLSFLILFLFCAQSLFAVVQEGTNPSGSMEESYVPNQLIVKYKEGVSPDQLQVQIDKEKSSQRNIIGFIKSIFQNISSVFNSKETAKDQLNRIHEIDNKIGVKEKEKLYEGTADNSPLGNTYLLTTDGSVTVENAINEYKKLPEVEYAEPNHIMQIQLNEAL